MRPPIITRDNALGSVGVHANVVTTAGDSSMPFLAGRFAVFNEWAEISSASEGHFLERIAPGAFLRTIAEHRSRMRVLFNHGADPYVGNKPLAPVELLGEDERGGYFGGRLFRTAYNLDLIPALQAGQFGASFRFRVTGEDYEPRPDRSSHNPDRLPERTIREAEVFEFGPVTFPAYAGATAGARTGVPRLSHEDFLKYLDVASRPVRTPAWLKPTPETAAEREARRRWLDRVMPIPEGSHGRPN